MAKVMDELDFLIEHREREKAFHEAKEKGQDKRGKPASPKDAEAWRAEKERMREWRQHWREIREAFAPEPAEGDAVASPSTVGLKAEGKSV